MLHKWYEQVAQDAPLMQGELIQGCPTLSLPNDLAEFETGDTLSVKKTIVNAVVLTQSCDLVSKGVANVLLCPYYSYLDWIQRTKLYRNHSANGEPVTGFVNKELDHLKEGLRVHYHLLNKDDVAGFEDYQVVELNDAFSVERNVINQLLQKQSKRIQLSSPYREHLSQAYARLFMRVGLPVNIGSITKDEQSKYEPSAEFREYAKQLKKEEAEAKKRAEETK